jgi:putative peptide zinc metalloprotease protein
VAVSRAKGVVVIPNAADLVGRFVREGEVLAYVTPPLSRMVRVAVSQDDIGLVRHGVRRIDVKLASQLDQSFTAVVSRQVPAGQDELPSKALGSDGGGRFAVDPRDSKGTKAFQRVFQFDIELSTRLPPVGFGSRVHVRLEHDWEPLGFQIYRRVRQLLLSQLNA